jgi:hypothetical protein
MTRSIITLLAAISIAVSSAFAQLGSDNPTGITGRFNGNSYTGCSYDPYTANATRTVVDLSVSGAVTPLTWARTMNSRGGGRFFGSTSWLHSYDWVATTEDTAHALPDSYIVRFPDGRVINFAPSTKGDTAYNGPAGIGERFQQVQGDGECYLILTDGSKVQFHQNVTVLGDGSRTVVLKPIAVIDPAGLTTAFTLDASKRIIKITEPAGRWLNVTYDIVSGQITKVDAGYGASTITQSVAYTYGTRAYGNSYTVLDSVVYTTDTNSPSASYTYQPSNVSPFNGLPLISTCDDVHYPER